MIKPKVLSVLCTIGLLTTSSVNGVPREHRNNQGLHAQSGAIGNLIVISDNGQTTPIKPLNGDTIPRLSRAEILQALDRKNLKLRAEEILASRPTPQQQAQQLRDQIYPLVPTKLKQGVLIGPIIKELPLGSPIFIIGSDRWSIEWLELNKKELFRLGAIGLVTEVADLNTMLTIQRLAAPIMIRPQPADFIAEQFNLWHYPVLLTEQGVFQ